MLVLLKQMHTDSVELFEYDDSIHFDQFSYFLVENFYGIDIAKRVKISMPFCDICHYQSCEFKNPDTAQQMNKKDLSCFYNKDQSMPSDVYFPKVLRPAKQEEIASHLELMKQEDEIKAKAIEIAQKDQLNIKISKVYSFLERKKILFYFFSKERIDFREYLRDLAKYFNCRIELFQINIRDFARYSGGIGTCGYTICCSKFYSSRFFIHNQKNNLSRSSSQILGLCNRLKCCIKYEVY